MISGSLAANREHFARYERVSPVHTGEVWNMCVCVCDGEADG